MNETISDLLSWAANGAPERDVLICDGESLTYSELDERASAVAHGLLQRGLDPGDHVGVWLPNGADWLVAVFGAARAGMVVVPINTWFKSSEFTYVLGHSDVRALFVRERFLGQDYAAMVAAAIGPQAGAERGRVASEAFPDLRLLVSTEGDVEGATPLAELTARVAQTASELGSSGSPRPESAAFMGYTSGTTAFPKGALVSHRGLVRDAAHFAARLEVGEGSRYFCPVPFFHIAGFGFVVLAALTRQATIVTTSRFNAERAWEEIVRHSCAHTGGFEVIFQDLLVHRPLADSPLTSAWWAGGPPALFREVEQTLGVRLMNAYGLTEASGNATATPLDWPLEDRISLNGVPHDGVHVQVVDPLTREPLPDGSVGEIRVSGWGTMLGYYKNAEATARALDEDGWLHTGDLGLIGDRGALVYLGRNRDMIKVGGENVAPSEIEAVMASLPAISEVAVIGVPDERYGEVPIAFARPGQGERMTEQEVISLLREQIASFKVPRRLIWVEDFPRTSTGKVRKTELADRASEGAL